MARALAVIVATLLAASGAAQSGQKALLPVRVNETDRGEIFTIVVDGDVLIARSFIEELQLPLEGARVETVDGEAFVSLASMAPNVTHAINEEDLILAITVDPKLLGSRTLELRNPRVIADRGGDPSVFLNYGILGSGDAAPALALELGANRGHRFAFSGVNRTAEGDITRGLTYYAIESPEKLRRTTYGDAFVGSDGLGGNVTIGGVTLSRQFSLQPYFVRTPALDLQGTATTPSVVEVYVNGQLTNRVSVDPGTFTLRDLPATAGLGTATIVVRDAFGRELTQTQSFYYSSLALRKGLSDFVFSAGARRDNFLDIFDYGDPAGLAYYRRGLTDRLTVGGRAEATADLFSGGPSFTLVTPLGDFDLGLAGSEAGGRSGYAGSFAYRFNSPKYTFGVGAIRRSDEYANLSLDPQDDRTVLDAAVFASASFRFFNIGLSASRAELRDSTPFDRIALQTNVTFGRNITLFTSLGATRQNGDTEPEVLVGFTFGFGRDTANVQYSRALGEDSTIVQVRRPIGLANGFGYSLQHDTGADRQLAIVDYQTSYGRYQLIADPKELDESSYNIAGGLVHIGGRVIPARPVDESYALARVGVPGVEMFASNQSVGRTNRQGDLLIPNLLAHYANELRVNDEDIPLDYDIADTEVAVVPPTRGGVVATFPVRRLRSYTGSMMFIIIGERYSPGLGELRVKRGAETIAVPLGRAGEFYIDSLDAGTYDAQLLIGRVSCSFSLVLPDTPDAMTDLGEVRCEK